MPSPPLVPDDGPIDIAHLKRMTLGDAGLEREVLAMFAGQAVRLIEALAALPADAAEIAHTLNGSARAIGAFQVAEAAEAFEAALRDGEAVGGAGRAPGRRSPRRAAPSTPCCGVPDWRWPDRPVIGQPEHL